jgi:regulator of protease activity HflC (stomatin/prohibitin superfamily)
MRWWKVVGLAGLAGVAATGVVIARGERRRRAYPPDEVRSRLHERYAQAQQTQAQQTRAQQTQAQQTRSQQVPRER